jgi:hypothetical protein
VEILSGRDFNDSGEAKDGAHTTELLKEKEKKKLRLELEFLDQSRKRGRGERSGRLWLYGRAAIKKREQQQAGLAWLAGCLAARATRTGTGAAARGEWVQSLQWVDSGERVGWRVATPVAGRAGGLGTVGTGVAPAGRLVSAP